VADQIVKGKRIRISVDVPIELRRDLKSIANQRDMFFKDYLQDVFSREVRRQQSSGAAARSN
jgi:hypothetical protein